MVWLGCAAVLALAPKLTLVWLRVPALGPVPELAARPLPGLFRPALLRWPVPVRWGGVWLVE